MGDCVDNRARLRRAIARFLPKALTRGLSHRQRFVRQFLGLRRKLGSTPRLSMRWRERCPVMDEAWGLTGFDAHYFYHVSWAARKLAALRPSEHVDISSNLMFAGMLSASVPVRLYEYHPAPVHLENLQVGRADLLALPFADGSIGSLSCMHVVEHVGLGRYGDPLDPDGDLGAMGELKRVLAPGGDLLFVAPVGRPRIVFNAHRVYSYEHIVEPFGGLELREFALVPDDARRQGMIDNASPEEANAQEYGCGCFWFRRTQ